MTVATIGIALGQNNDITAEAAGAVILDSSTGKVDEFLHIRRRLRSIALQNTVGGMSLSLIGTVIAAAGYLPPVAGAIAQEVVDMLAVANALQMAIQPRILTDCEAVRLGPEGVRATDHGTGSHEPISSPNPMPMTIAKVEPRCEPWC